MDYIHPNHCGSRKQATRKVLFRLRRVVTRTPAHKLSQE